MDNGQRIETSALGKPTSEGENFADYCLSGWAGSQGRKAGGAGKAADNVSNGNLNYDDISCGDCDYDDCNLTDPNDVGNN